MKNRKPKRSRHRGQLPPWHESRPVVLEPAYEGEVQAASLRLAHDHAKALRHAEAADRRAQRAETRADRRAATATMRRAAETARAAAEQAWLEFNRLDKMMREAPESSSRRRVRHVGGGGPQDQTLPKREG